MFKLGVLIIGLLFVCSSFSSALLSADLSSEIAAGSVEVDSSVKVASSAESDGDTVRVTLSNGETATIRYTAVQAKARAREEARIMCESNCSVLLTTTLTATEARVAYRVQDSYRARFLFIFPITIRTSADIDAETGAVLHVQRPITTYLSVRSAASVE